MIYFDASYLVPMVRREVLSDRLIAFVASVARERLVTSFWTLVECRSGLAREVRMNRMPLARFESCCRHLDDLITEGFDLVLPLEDDYRRASNLVERPDSGLRAGDAVHLAVAERLGARLVLSLDNKMISIGRSRGIPAGMGFESQ